MRLSAAVPLAALMTFACSSGPGFPYQNPNAPVERRADDLLRRMTPEEKLAVLKGAPVQRLGIPAIHTDEGALAGRVFPPDIAMAAAWDPGLVAQEARIIAREALAHGHDQVLGPMLKTADGANSTGGYGEDPWLASRIAVAYVSAMQGEGAIATLRCFPAGNPGSVKTDERALNEIYFPPFRAAVEEAGAWAIMPASPANLQVVTDVLEKDWGFKGFVITPAASAGRADDDEVRRVLRAMFAAGMFERGPVKETDSKERRLTAWNATAESMVLLKNQGDVLPLPTGKVHSIAVIGSALAGPGIGERAGTLFQVGIASGDSVKEATDLARKSDAAIVTGPDDLIQAVAGANKNTIAILNEGSPVHAARWMNQVPALLSAWLAGPDSGHAIAAVVFGDINPSGKLPFTIPPFTAPDSSADASPEGIYVGYRYFDKHNVEPLFPFGYGLSYTTFALSDLRIFPATPRYGQLLQLAMKVRNTGARAGAEVVQVYVHQVKSSVDRPVRELKAFQRVALKPGETREVTFELDRRAMSFYDPVVKTWATEPGVFEVLVGASSRDIRLKGAFELFE
jgi:beta-glucosidase